MNNEHAHNALLDPTTEFALVPSPRLRELIAKDEHPVVQKMTPKMKLIYMECPPGKALPVSREIILRFLDGSCSEDERFVLGLCDIRFWATTSVETTRNVAKTKEA